MNTTTTMTEKAKIRVLRRCRYICVSEAGDDFIAKIMKRHLGDQLLVAKVDCRGDVIGKEHYISWDQIDTKLVPMIPPSDEEEMEWVRMRRQDPKAQWDFPYTR